MSFTFHNLISPKFISQKIINNNEKPTFLTKIKENIINFKFIDAFNTFLLFSKTFPSQLLSVSSSIQNKDKNNEKDKGKVVSNDDKTILMSIFILNIIKHINSSNFLSFSQEFQRLLEGYLCLQKKDTPYFELVSLMTILPIHKILRLKNNNLPEKYVRIICNMLVIREKVLLFETQLERGHEYISNISISIEDISLYHDEYNQLKSLPIEVISILSSTQIFKITSKKRKESESQSQSQKQKQSEAEKKFQFSFTKKENISKLLIRRFLKYAKSNENTLETYKTIMKRTNNSLPPFKLGNGVSFKSINYSFLRWLFMIENVKETFCSYISYYLDGLIGQFNEKYLISHEENLLLKEYLSVFYELYSS